MLFYYMLGLNQRIWTRPPPLKSDRRVCKVSQLHPNLFMLDEVTPLAEHVLNVMLVLKKCSWPSCSALQGRQGPKGDPGDSGLPGQKVSAALDKKRFWDFKQETGIIHNLTTGLASGRTQTVFQLVRIQREKREFMNITFKLNFCGERAKNKSPWWTALVQCWPAVSGYILLLM